MSWGEYDNYRDTLRMPAGYDAWKTDPGYPPEDECYHEHYEANTEGRATCDQCGETWWLTPEEIERERECHAVYDKMMRREERRQFWLWLTLWFRMPIHRLLSRVWPRKACSVLADDEIPF